MIIECDDEDFFIEADMMEDGAEAIFALDAVNDSTISTATIDPQESTAEPSQPQLQDTNKGKPTKEDLQSLAGDFASQMPNLVQIGFDVKHEEFINVWWEVHGTPATEGEGRQVSLVEMSWYKGTESMRRAAKRGPVD